MQKPTVGRIVHYHDEIVDGVEPSPSAAMVTHCFSESKVNLVIYQRWADDRKGFKPEVPFSEEPKPGHWSWPPRV